MTWIGNWGPAHHAWNTTGAGAVLRLCTCGPYWSVMPPPPFPVHDGQSSFAARDWPYIPQDDIDTAPIDVSTPVDIAGPDPFTVPITGGRWCWIPDDVAPDGAAYDDRKDHTPCDYCNPSGRAEAPGWIVPFVGPRELCDRCDGSGWV